MTTPNAFIIGAPRSGTTAMFSYLSDHPQVGACRQKEPHYFSTDIENFSWAKNEDHYLSMFPRNDPEKTILLEASPLYLYSKDAVRNILEFNPASKLIIIVRSHAEMLPSWHSQLVRSADEDLEDFGQAWAAVPERRSGNKIPPFCRNVRFLYYDEIASVGRQTQAALSLASNGKALVIVFDDLRERTEEVYRKTLGFLGLEYDGRTEFSPRNENTIRRWRRLTNLTQRPPRAALRGAAIIRRIVGAERLNAARTLRRLNTVRRPRAPLAGGLRRELVEHYRDDRRLLESILDRDLSGWECER